MTKARETKTQAGEHYGWIVDCPGCKQWHVLDDRWTFNGDAEKPTFNPSLLVNGNQQYRNHAVPRCHSFIRDGNIQFLDDCTHELAGKTVPLNNLDEE